MRNFQSTSAVPLSAWRRYGMVPALLVVALLLRLVLKPVLGHDVPFLILWPAVMVAAWYGGLGPGIVTTVVSAILSAYIFFDQNGVIDRHGWTGMSLFVLLGLAISMLLHKLHQAHDSLAANALELFEQRERLRVTLTSIGDAVLATDTEGRITFLNPIAQVLTGWTEKDAVGRQFEEVFNAVHERTREPIESPIRKVLQTGLIVGLANHTVLLTRGGAEVPIDDSAAPIRDAHGYMTGVVMVFRDIAERRRMLQALEEANKHKDDFLALLGHELRNPLAPIRNAVYLLRRHGPMDEQIRWISEVIHRQVQQMSHLVDDLLDVSRINRGKLRLQRERVDLLEIVQQALDTSRPLLEAKQHVLHTTLPEGPVWLDADPTRLAQVIGNLLNNAAKYTDPGGHLALAVESHDGEILVRVRDNGIGIAPKMLPRIFEMFTQADRALARSQGGLGLGLALVKSLVEMHGGTIEAFSQGLGKGTEFVVHLPAAKEEPVQDETMDGSAAPIQRAGSSGCRVLVVDDNVDAAESLAMLLEMEGHEVYTAHDGPATLAAVREHGPDAVFLDIGLPGMDGYEVARRLRAASQDQPRLLVALTGYGQDQDRHSAQMAGFDIHLVKPVDLNTIRQLLSQMGATARQAVPSE